MNWRQQEKGGQPSLWPSMLLLAGCFLCGVIGGQVLAGKIPSETGRELETYLQHYVALKEDFSAREFLSAVILYLRYPLLAVLLGFASIGVLLLPGVTVAFGFFLSFSVCCFTAAFGTPGVILSLAVLGIRCAVTLPCYFLLAGPSWRQSVMLAQLSFGRGRRLPVQYGRNWWLRTVVCFAVLLAGMCVDLMISPWILRIILERILA